MAATVDGASISADITPVLVLINTSSGNRGGGLLYHWFCELLNPLQVWDVSEGGALLSSRVELSPFRSHRTDPPGCSCATVRSHFNRSTPAWCLQGRWSR